MWTRRAFLAGLAGLAATGPALAGRGGIPPAVAQALRHPRYRGLRILSVRQRRPAPTADGWMYEVAVEGRDRRRYLVYVDPATGRALYDTGPR